MGGYSRSTTGELKYHIGIARGENAELQTQILIAKGLYLGSPEAIDKAEQLADEAGRLLTGLWHALTK
jgi:four helix bundle protein